MGIVELLGALASILAALLPVFITHHTLKEKRDEDLTNHSISELHIGTDRVRNDQPPV